MWGLFIFLLLSQWMVVASATFITYITSGADLSDPLSLWPTAVALGLCVLLELVGMVILYVVFEKTRKDHPSLCEGMGGCLCIDSPSITGCDTLAGFIVLVATVLIVGILLSSLVNSFLVAKIFVHVTEDRSAEDVEM